MKGNLIDSVITLCNTLSSAADSVGGAIADTAKFANEKVAAELLKDGNYEAFLQILIENAVNFGTRILLAILVYTIGKWIMNRIKKFIEKILEKKDVEPSLASFFRSLINIVLSFVLIICVIGVLGIETTSFVALFASAGVAIGMALSGTLQNFAGGVMILLFKPFKVGDYIDANGQSGTVKEIQIFNTIINTVDNKTIIVPNGGLSTSVMTNYSKESTRRVDWVFGIAYGDNYDTAKEILLDLINKDERILKDKAPFVALNTLNSSSVDIVVRVWVNSSDYWGVYFDMNEKVYKTFTEKGINIPFPQMDVYVHPRD